MSEILGHDVNGRPLRAGDWFERLTPNARTHFGLFGWVVGPPVTGGDFQTDSGWGLFGHQVRRIDDRTDHQPSEYTFDSLMDHLKSGVPA